MQTTIVIHTTDLFKLKNILKQIKDHKNFNSFHLILEANGYTPWDNKEILDLICSFRSYNAMPTQDNEVRSIVRLLLKSQTDRLLLIDEKTFSESDLNLVEWDDRNLKSIFTKKDEILQYKLDTNYQTLNAFIIDLFSQRKNMIYGKHYFSNENDLNRYNKKIESELFYESIIYIDGGLGDHVMALPFLYKNAKDSYICCKYENFYSHIESKGFISWNDPLFGGYNRFVYEFGSANNTPTIIEAFFNMYGQTREIYDILEYKGEIHPINKDVDKLALICTSAAKIQNLPSNKDWKDIRWFKLVHELKKMGYYVVQVGGTKDNQIPNVDLKFLDKTFSELAGIIKLADLWISVDTFFHHFASSINPMSGICLTPFYNDHAKHPGVRYIEKDCGKNYYHRRWWLDLQQPERKDCMDLIQITDVLNVIHETESILHN